MQFDAREFSSSEVLLCFLHMKKILNSDWLKRSTVPRQPQWSRRGRATTTLSCNIDTKLWNTPYREKANSSFLRARAILFVFEKLTRAYLFQMALEIMWLPILIGKEFEFLARDVLVLQCAWTNFDMKRHKIAKLCEVWNVMWCCQQWLSTKKTTSNFHTNNTLQVPLSSCSLCKW